MRFVRHAVLCLALCPVNAGCNNADQLVTVAAHRPAIHTNWAASIRPLWSSRSIPTLPNAALQPGDHLTFDTQSVFASSTNKAFKTWVTAAAISFATTGASHAVDITPNLAIGSAGWSTDRYQPNLFANVGSFAGRNDVLGIGISTAQGALNRSPSYTQAQFYNTQGMIQPLIGGAGSTISADLYIDSDWRSSANGNVRTDIWGITSDDTRTATDPYSHRVAYPRIGFTNSVKQARGCACRTTATPPAGSTCPPPLTTAAG